jgi:outer membrane murein-binding lipoprotein Lpp
LRKELRDVELMLRIYQEWLDANAATMRGYTDKMLKGPLASTDRAKLDELGTETEQLQARTRALSDDADKLRAAIAKCDKECTPPSTRAVPQPPGGAGRDQPKPVTPTEPTAEELRRAEQLFSEQPGPTNNYVPLPQPSAPPANAVIPARPQQPAQPTATIPGKPPTPTTPPVTPPPPTATTPPPPTTTPTPPPPKPPATTPTAPANPPAAPPPPKPPGFSGTWAGNGGCGFSSIVIVDQGGTLLVQGLPGNGTVNATSNGTSAQAQGVVMFGKPNHQVTMMLQGNQLTFQASSSTGSCADSLSRR